MAQHRQHHLCHHHSPLATQLSRRTANLLKMIQVGDQVNYCDNWWCVDTISDVCGEQLAWLYCVTEPMMFALVPTGLFNATAQPKAEVQH